MRYNAHPIEIKALNTCCIFRPSSFSNLSLDVITQDLSNVDVALYTRTGILSDVGLVLVRAGAMGAASLLVCDTLLLAQLSLGFWHRCMIISVPSTKRHEPSYTLLYYHPKTDFQLNSGWAHMVKPFWPGFDDFLRESLPSFCRLSPECQ